MSIKMTGTNPDPTGATAFQRADIDPALTRPTTTPPPDQEGTNDVTTGKSGSKTLGNIREFYAADKVKELDVVIPEENADAPKPEHSPNSWVGNETDDGIFRGADPYRNQGLSGPAPGRDYLENQGS